MSRDPQKFEFGDVELTVTPLPYQKAEDILPDVLLIVSHVIRQVVDSGSIEQLKQIKSHADVVKLLPILAPIMQTLAERLGDGKLKYLVPLVLAGTRVKLPDDTGQLEKLELVKLSERAKFFDAHPELYLITVFLSGKVTFARFFSVRGLLGGKAPDAES